MFCVFVACGCSLPKYNQSEVNADLKYLKTKLCNVHPDPFFTLTECEFDSISRDVERLCMVEGNVSQKQFYCYVNPMVARLDDGHTRVDVPYKTQMKGFFWGSKILPLALRFSDTCAYVVTPIRESDSLRSGDRVVNINGIAMGGGD
ncbi:hypothetical protein SAMN05216323_105222 [Williamwhitmania taraxaci]|uniref:Uncharacterized protein n=1 Tax=Williamwhitmania taraxaci TaxID=1640674 RepID=A0A1G6PLA3_9BACT|nr:hypothetical protein SAMN05216323_105222 [Williamwhitmania taraxaci]